MTILIGELTPTLSGIIINDAAVCVKLEGYGG